MDRITAAATGDDAAGPQQQPAAPPPRCAASRSAYAQAGERLPKAEGEDWLQLLEAIADAPVKKAPDGADADARERED